MYDLLVPRTSRYLMSLLAIEQKYTDNDIRSQAKKLFSGVIALSVLSALSFMMSFSLLVNSSNHAARSSSYFPMFHAKNDLPQ